MPETEANKTESSNDSPTPPNNPTWMAQLSADLQGHKGLTQFATISDLGKAYVDLEGKSKNAVAVPGEGATEQQVRDFYTKLGCPAKPEDYKFERPTLPDGMEYDAESEKFFRELAHKEGVSGKALNALYAAYNAQQVKAFQQMQEAADKAKADAATSLKAEWGDGFKTKMVLAERAVLRFGGDALKTELNESALGNHPALAKALAAIGEAMGDDKVLTGGGGSPATNKKGFYYPSLENLK